MKGDRVEAVVDTGQGTQTFEIVATRAGRRIEVTTARGVVEVTEVTRSGTPVRTGRFMASRLVALVEHPQDRRRRSGSRCPDAPHTWRLASTDGPKPSPDAPRQLTVLGDEEEAPSDDGA